MQTSKIHFSREELELAENSEMILTKNRIIKKVISAFGSVADEYRTILDRYRYQLPSECFTQGPKISRGEQYLGLPYVMLDYPRIFSKDDVFAIRTFFWWGNYFSLTLHLKGRYKQSFGKKIRDHFELFAQNEYCVAVSDDEWKHDLGEQNYIPLRKGGQQILNEQIEQGSFLKLAVKWTLERSNEIEVPLKEQFAIILNIIAG